MDKKILIIGILLLAGLIILNSGFVYASDEKISLEVYKSLDNKNETRVIVEIKEPDSEKGIIIKTEKSQAEIEKEKTGIKEDIKQDIGEEKVKHEFDNQISLEVSQEDLKKLNENPDVKTVSLVGKMHAFLQDSVPLINASLVWPLQVSGANLTGIDETVCIVDTGANFSHPDLIGKNKTCVIDCVEKACVENCSVGDDNGHGTHVAGIVAANGGIKGVGIGINLIGVKALDAAGTGYYDDVYAGIDWCVSNSAAYNISVISMSLGDCTNHSSYCNTDGSATHINAAVAKNISVVVAAGNGPGGNCPSTGFTNVNGPAAPACVENATAIGAVSKSDVINYQRGNLFEIMMPGISINSTKSTGGYEVMSGTSMATPHAAAAFAVVREGFRLLNNRVPTPIEIRNILNNSGKVIYDSSTGYSFSRINVYAAILSLDNIAPNVNLVSPLDNSINTTLNQNFSCNATDLQLANVTFYLWNSSNGIVYNATRNIIGAANTSVFDVTNLNYADYKWNCLFYDANNNPAFASSNFSYSIGNISVSLLSPANNLYTNQSQTDFNCSSRTAPIFNLTNVTFYIWNSTGSLVYNLSQNISGLTNISGFNYSFTLESNYSWNCNVFNNNSDNAFASSNFSIKYDITAPGISSIVTSVTTTTSTITWDTSENTNASLSYGTGISNLNLNSINSSFVLNHTISLTSLTSSTIYYYNITNCDNAGNCITNGTNNFTTSAAEAVVSSSSGGGGGGGGSISNTYNISYEQVSKGYTQLLNKNDKIKFVFFDTKFLEHTLIVNNIKDNSVNLTIRSSPINLLLGVGQSAKLNLTSPDYYDLYIKLEGIENNKARITIQTINEKIPGINIKDIINKSIEKPANVSAANNFGDNKELEHILDLLKIMMIIIIIGVIIIIISLVIIISRDKKKNKEKNIKEYKEKFKEISPKK